MAILKDLIVHGSSRFLNKIYAEELETSAFEAESAIIKKLTAKDATLENATVVGLLDVQGQLHTNTWTNSNIATIDGCFYITPTLSSDTGSIVFTSTTAASLTGTYAAVTSLYIGDSSSGSTVQWTKDSNVLLTGEVEVNGQWLPLGTLLGTLSANATTSSIGLTGLTDNRHNPSSIITDIRNAVSNASLSYRNLKISLYQRKDGNDSKPLGIYMTAMGANGKTFIDIYGGVNATTTAGSSGGFADPNLRIGNLSGLGAVEGTTPTGWGIYTTNGYFKGVIVSSAGKIGNFTINSALYSNNHSAWNSNVSGIYINNDGISGGAGGKWWLWNDGSAKIGEMTLSAAGVLTVPAANVSGKLTAATIDGTQITANSITASQIAANAITADELAANAVTSAKIKAGEVKADNIAANAVTAGKISVDNLRAISANMGTLEAGVIKHDTVGGTNGIWLSADTNTSSNITVGNSTARNDWRLLVNNKFGVTSGGDLYASSVDITGKIKADQGQIGDLLIENGRLIFQSGARNLLKSKHTNFDQESNNIVSSEDRRIKYSYYQLELTEKLKANETYSFQLWGVDLIGNGEILNIYLSTNNLDENSSNIVNTLIGNWSSDNFTDGHADYLLITFTLTQTEINTVSNSDIDYIKLSSSSGTDIIIEKWKLEKGNRETDWSFSPEEFQDTINTINDNATEISSSLNNYMIDTDSRLNNFQTLLQGNTTVINQLNNNLINYNNWITFDTEEQNSIMTLGIDNSSVRVVLTDERLNFLLKGEDDPITYIGTDSNGVGRLFTTNITIEGGQGELKIGNWVWHERSNGNFNLKKV